MLIIVVGHMEEAMNIFYEGMKRYNGKFKLGLNPKKKVVAIDRGALVYRFCWLS